MNTTDTKMQYSILGTPVQLKGVDGEILLLHAPLRLGPGRAVSIRNGAATFQATVLSAHIFSLDPEHGPIYELQVEPLSRTASPAVDAETSKKGGWWQRGMAPALGTA